MSVLGCVSDIDVSARLVRCWWSPTWKEIQLPSSFGFACFCVSVVSVPYASLIPPSKVFVFAIGGYGYPSKVAVNVGDNTPSGDRRLDEVIEFVVSTDSQVEMAGSDALHLQVLRRVASEFENLEWGG
uniref:DUF2235 domain-containing protein n=1 Tax=Steinernema glaseri TaxID=37863 RepID=A0A1I7YP51_9BILA